MLESCVRLQATSGQQRVFEAHGGGFAKGSAYVKLIIPFQKTAVNDAADFVLMIQPVISRKLISRGMDLPFQALAGGRVVAIFQRKPRRLSVFLGEHPRLVLHRVFSFPCVGYVKHIAELGLTARIIHQRDALGAATDIAAHFVVPQIILGAGRRIRALGVDHELFVIGVFIQSRGGFEKARPFLTAVRQAGGGILRKLQTGSDVSGRHILLFKQPIHTAANVINLPFAVGVCGYQRNERVRVMPNIVQFILELVVLRMVGGIAVNGLLQFVFQPLVVSLRGEDIHVLGGVGGDDERL